MRTPADFFRKHQKILLPVITGLAIIAFLVQDASNGNVQNMSPMLVVVTLAVLCGGAAWVAGMAKDKGSEYGLVGVIVGVVVALVVNMYRKEGPTLSHAEQQRAIKEIQVAGAVASFGGRTMISDPRLRMALLGDPSRRHALLEEARSLGVHLDDDVGGWQMKNAGMTRENYDTIKKHYQVSDSLITDALRHEAEASLVAHGLFGDGMILAPPVDWWDSYQKLNVRQSAQVVPLPVDQFVDQKAEPKEADLVTLFEEYRRNQPGFTFTGQPEEGRPGFFQLPRVKASYLMAHVEDFAAFVPQPTAEEVEARYKERFAQPLPPKSGVDGSGPVLPVAPAPKGNAEPMKEGAGAPAKPAAPMKETPKDEAPKSESPDAGKPASEKPAEEKKVEDKKDQEKKDDGKKDEKPSEESKSSNVRREDGTVEVAAIDEPATKGDSKPAEAAPAVEEKGKDGEKPATAPAKEGGSTPAAPSGEKPAPEKPATEKPSAEKPANEKSAGDKPATEKSQQGDAAVDPATPPAPPLSKMVGGIDDEPLPPSMKVVPLDDELRAKLREEIIEERAEEIIRARCDQAVRQIQNVLDQARAPKVSPKPGETPPAPPEGEDADVLTPEQAKAAIQKIAADLNLELVETPLFSPTDVEESKDNPLKNATVPGSTWRAGVLQALFAPGSPLNTVVRGSNSASKVEMAIWKTEEGPAHEPKSLEECRDQVVKTWRTLEARKVAEKRAEELVALARKELPKPLTESLRDATVTGAKDSLIVAVKPTGSFAWLTDRSFLMQFGQPGTPGISFVAGVDKPGEGFMKTVFEKLKPGDIGTAFNADKSVCYVVQIESRDTAKPEEMEKLRERFVKDRQNADAARVASQQMAEAFRGNPFERVIPPASATLIEE